MDIQALLDRDVVGALARLPPMRLSAANLAAVREARAADWELFELSDAVERRDVLVPGAPGEPDVALRIHRPRGVDGALGCIYWMHGGGMVLGRARQDDQRFDRWCARHRCVGVAVEYRLAPETPYPGPLDDCYAGLGWVAAHADDLGIDATRIGLGGVSAGGGLAAGLALLARDRGEVSVSFQLLVYPMIDDRGVTASSGWDVPVWPPASNAFGWSAYLGGRAGAHDVPAYAAPARADDVAGLPEALVVVGALDGFLDEDIAYAQRMMWAGVPVELHVYPGAPHGFDGFAPDAAVARQCRRDVNGWLARVVASR